MARLVSQDRQVYRRGAVADQFETARPQQGVGRQPGRGFTTRCEGIDYEVVPHDNDDRQHGVELSPVDRDNLMVCGWYAGMNTA